MTSPVMLDDAGLTLGDRTLWSGLDLQVEAGAFFTVLGPNGSGKSSLLRVLLGLRQLTAGTARINGCSPRRGRREVGYVPQHRGFEADVPLRGIDLVQQGLDGHRWGLPSRRSARARDLLEEVGAAHLAGVPLGRMSGGEQQRVRIAQALATEPAVLLCDEPLLTLDPHHQARIVELLDRRRRDHGTVVVFVTHEINAVLAVTDAVLYLMAGRAAVGTPDEVFRDDVLSALYGSAVEVVRRADRLAVLGAVDCTHPHDDHQSDRVAV